MKRPQRLLPLFAVVLGFLGSAACVAAIIMVGSMRSRLSRTNEKLFDGIDQSLVVVRDRVLAAQRLVQDSKITTEEIGHQLKHWTQQETSERLASRIEIEDKAERLMWSLQQADLWLEMSGATIQSVRQVLELGSSLGAPVDITLVDPLVEKLGTLRSQLNLANETVDGIRERASQIAEGESGEERMGQAVQLALRVLATLGEIDLRLGESAEKLGDTRAGAQQLESQSRTIIVTATMVAIFLIAWMAAGQVSLCRQGWNGFRQS